jgi:hypothetical protein
MSFQDSHARVLEQPKTVLHSKDGPIWQSINKQNQTVGPPLSISPSGIRSNPASPTSPSAMWSQSQLQRSVTEWVDASACEDEFIINASLPSTDLGLTRRTILPPSFGTQGAILVEGSKEETKSREDDVAAHDITQTVSPKMPQLTNTTMMQVRPKLDTLTAPIFLPTNRVKL